MPNLTKYSLDCTTRTSFEMGQLIPFLCQEVVPGDKYRVQSSSLVRLHPMVAPIMHHIDYFQRFYYVPYRLLYEPWEKMMTDPDSNLTLPTLLDALRSGSGATPVSSSMSVKEFLSAYPLLQYFGLDSYASEKFASDVFAGLNPFPLYAYYLIYNYYYMRTDLDPDYIDDFKPSNFYSSSVVKHLGKILYVNEGLDYFTSAVKSTQYGDMVQLDMDGNTTITVPEMRLAERLQSFRERLLRVGNRYMSYLKEFFDTAPLDARVQQPKFLGGDSFVLNVDDVDQTAPSENDPVGTSYGKSLSVNGTRNVEYDVHEHGLIIGLQFCRPRVSNVANCPRHWLNRSYFDFYNPHFASLGYQELNARELDPSRSGTFGYHPRYENLRHGQDLVSGDFRDTLSFWHLSRDISQENLSTSFVKAFPDNRVFSYIGEYDRNSRAMYLVTFTTPQNTLVSGGSPMMSAVVWCNKGAIVEGESYALTYRGVLSSDSPGATVSLEFNYDNVDTTLAVTVLEVTEHSELYFNTISECLVSTGDKVGPNGRYIPGISIRDQTRIMPTDDGKTAELTLRPTSDVVLHPSMCFIGATGGRLSRRVSDDFRIHASFDKGSSLLAYFLPVCLDDVPRSYLKGTSYVVEEDYTPNSFSSNHVMATTYNNVSVLRPLPYYDHPIL